MSTYSSENVLPLTKNRMSMNTASTSLTLLCSKRNRIRNRTSKCMLFVTCIVLVGYLFWPFSSVVFCMLNNDDGYPDPPPCSSKFEDTFTDNIQTVLHYPVGDAEGYLADLGVRRPPSSFQITAHANLTHVDTLTLVTYANANHFDEVQALIHNVHTVVFPVYRERVHFIFYDLGLTSRQAELLKKYCKCEVRRFPFEKYPVHVSDANSFAWKPIVIQSTLQTHNLVMWMDASVRFRNATVRQDLSYLINRVRINGLLVLAGDGPMPCKTSTHTFKFLGEEPCLFHNYSGLTGTWGMVSRSDFTLNAVMRPWVSCALNYGCMAVRFSCRQCGKGGGYGHCHEYDQSVLAIIVTRLFGEHRDNIIEKHEAHFDIRRGHTMTSYFPEHPSFFSFVREIVWSILTLRPSQARQVFLALFQANVHALFR
jgi:hypothetical protein